MCKSKLNTNSDSKINKSMRLDFDSELDLAKIFGCPTLWTAI